MTRLKQLLENLIGNAMEHTDSRTQSGETDEHGGPDVTITISEIPGGFAVSDDGPGIPEADREAVFESGYSTATDGTGFGLSIVSQIAGAHGWTVTLTDSDSGGARFEFTGVDVVSEE
jgi:signal transduction histidine kinase